MELPVKIVQSFSGSMICWMACCMSQMMSPNVQSACAALTPGPGMSSSAIIRMTSAANVNERIFRLCCMCTCFLRVRDLPLADRVQFVDPRRHAAITRCEGCPARIALVEWVQVKVDRADG